MVVFVYYGECGSSSSYVFPLIFVSLSLICNYYKLSCKLFENVYNMLRMFRVLGRGRRIRGLGPENSEMVATERIIFYIILYYNIFYFRTYHIEIY